MALLIFGCSFFDPIRLRFCPLESFAIASTAHTHPPSSFDSTCIFILPRHVSTQGEISGLERATIRLLIALSENSRVFEKNYRWKKKLDRGLWCNVLLNIFPILWFAMFLRRLSWTCGMDSFIYYRFSMNEFYREENKRTIEDIFQRYAKYNDGKENKRSKISKDLSKNRGNGLWIFGKQNFQILESIESFVYRVILVFRYRIRFNFEYRIGTLLWRSFEKSTNRCSSNYFPAILISETWISKR